MFERVINYMIKTEKDALTKQAFVLGLIFVIPVISYLYFFSGLYQHKHLPFIIFSGLCFVMGFIGTALVLKRESRALAWFDGVMILVVS